MALIASFEAEDKSFDPPIHYECFGEITPEQFKRIRAIMEKWPCQASTADQPVFTTTGD